MRNLCLLSHSLIWWCSLMRNHVTPSFIRTWCVHFLKFWWELLKEKILGKGYYIALEKSFLNHKFFILINQVLEELHGSFNTSISIFHCWLINIQPFSEIWQYWRFIVCFRLLLSRKLSIIYLRIKRNYVPQQYPNWCVGLWVQQRRSVVSH